MSVTSGTSVRAQAARERLNAMHANISQAAFAMNTS